MLDRIQQNRNHRYHDKKKARHLTSMRLPMFLIGSLFLAFVLVSGTSASTTQQTSVDDDDATGSTIIGIDLGTTYSCVGVYKNGKVEILPNEQGNRITPSYVAFTDTGGERLVGDAAKNQATINPQNTIFDVKRLIGRRYSDASVQADKKLVPYTIVGDKNDQPRIKVRNTMYAPEEISAMILRKMKEIAETHLGQEVTRAVVTVPAYFNQQQRLSTKDAGAIAGLQVERIINEPTAAALAYGIDKDLEDATILVYDLGGGTFDVTLLSIDDGVFDVLATSGDTHLGGEDFDQRVMQHFIKKLKAAGTDITTDSRALQKLRKEVERVKRSLSSQTQARIEIDDLVPGLDFTETLTRAKFEDLNSDLFQKTLEPVKTVLKNAKIAKSDVDRIVLVGGSTRIPKIQSLLTDFFGQPVFKGIDPDEAVAKGAAIQAANMSGKHKDTLNHLILLDAVSLSMGIETVGGVMTSIIPRGTTLPTKKSRMFSTSADSQSTVSIQIFEGERAMTKGNHLLGRFDLSGIPPAPRGVPQIEVTFEVDANGILQVSAADKGTGKEEKITITADQGRLSKEEIDRMLHDAEVHAEEDRKVVQRMQAHNSLESYLHNLKQTVLDEEGNSKMQVSSSEKKELLDNVEETLDWLESNPEATQEECEEKLHEIQQIANPIIRRAYSRGSDDNAGDDVYDDEL